jgi:TadE-like protein
MRRRDPRSGSALIEFAFSLMMLSAMFTGIFQVGFTFYSYNAMVNAVSAGARYASLQPAGLTDPEIAKSVRNMVVYGDPAPVQGAKPVVPGLTTEHVTLILGPTTATVTIRDFEIDALFSKVKLDGRPTVTFPIRGQVAKE